MLDIYKFVSYNRKYKKSERSLQMKKFLLKLVTFVLMIFCLGSIVACDMPELNLAKTKRNLEYMDYEIEIINGDELKEYGMYAYGVEEVFFAESEEGDNGIIIIYFEKASLARACFKMMKAELKGEIDCLKAEIRYYEMLVREYEYQILSEDLDNIKDEIKDCNKYLIELEEKYEYMGRSGEFVWCGTKRAIEDSK